MYKYVYLVEEALVKQGQGNYNARNFCWERVGKSLENPPPPFWKIQT